VTVGVASTDAPVVALKPAAGDHVNVAGVILLVTVSVVFPPKHIAKLGLGVITGVGFTDTVNVCTGPKQALAWGVTVNTPDAVTVPVFTAVKGGIELPLPNAPMPMVTLLFAQVYVVPDTFDENISVPVGVLLQTDWNVGVTVMMGVGFTVMVKVSTGPKQAVARGVTVNTPAVAAEPVLVAVNDAITDPLPEAPIPIVHIYRKWLYRAGTTTRCRRHRKYPACSYRSGICRSK